MKIKNDNHLIYEAYASKKNLKLVNELDVGGDWAGGGSDTFKKQIKQRHKEGQDVYLINAIAKSLNMSIDNAADLLGSKVFNHAFKPAPILINGKKFPFSNDAKNEDQFRKSLIDAINKALQDIAKQHPELKLPGSEALKVYTSRIISNMGGFAKDFQKGKFGATSQTKEKIKSAVKNDKSVKVNDPVSSPTDSSAPTQTGPDSGPVVDDEDAGLDVYDKGEFPTKTKDYIEIFDELKDTYKVSQGSDLYDSEEFVDDVRRIIDSREGLSKDQKEEEVKEFIGALKFHRDENKLNAFGLRSKNPEDVVGDESDDLSPVEQGLKDIGADLREMPPEY